MRVRAFDLPVSRLLSPKTQRIMRRPPEIDPDACPSVDDPANITIERISAIRRCIAQKQLTLVKKMKVQFAVESERTTIARVPVDVFLPRRGVYSENRHRVLINVHGGGFVFGDPNLESIPIAGSGRLKVIGVNYRMAPEFQFPAASEDVAAVYRELLKEYAPRNIGIYGCSAGARIIAQSMAWFQKVRLPNPGAIGMFSSAAGRSGDGDSAYIGSGILGMNVVGDTPWRVAYFGKNTNLSDPLVTPLSSARVMKRFPPSLLISSIRDFGLSNVVATHAELVKLGVPAELHVWEGLGHCFFLDPQFPESLETYRLIVRYFASHLGRDQRVTGADAVRASKTIDRALTRRKLRRPRAKSKKRPR